MTKLEHIEKSVEALSDEEIKAFAEWFAELQADRWDRQIEEDAKAGRLDKFAEKALTAHRAGRTNFGKPTSSCRLPSGGSPIETFKN